MRWNCRIPAGLLIAPAACTGEEAPTGPGLAEVSPATPLAQASNTWTELGPHPLAAVHSFSAGVLTNSANQSLVFTFGGIDDEGGTGWRIQRYNAATDTWRSDTAE